MTRIEMTRRVAFSAAHTEWTPALLAKQQPIGLEDASIATPETDGCSYILDVTVSGEIDLRTGIVVNIKEIDQVVRRAALTRLDHRLLNGRYGVLQGLPVTGELLIQEIRKMLASELPEDVKLSALRLESGPLDVHEWRSTNPEEVSAPQPPPGQTLATRVYEFSASHRLHSQHLSDQENRELFGKCNYINGHGHNYILEVTITGPINPHSGAIVRKEDLDAVVQREVVDRYDHRHLNLDIPEFENLIPSSEVLTRVIWDRLVLQLPTPAKLYRVLIRETPRNFFEYYGKD